MARTAPYILLETALARHRELRGLLSVSIHEYKRALSLCRERLGYRDDFLLALAWVDANSFAISVKGDRGAYNDGMAALRVDALFGHVDLGGLFEEANSPTIC